MAPITFRFNRRKALEVILYLASRVSESDIYGICKLLYLVDKTSLEKYGRFVFGESYVAMGEGATPSNAYDLLKEATQSPISGLQVKGVQVIALREANLDYLSESDIECLDQIISIYGKVPNWARAKDAHDAAWQKAWDNRGAKRSVKIPVEGIAELLADSGDIINHLHNSDTR
jgi:uncharacterized phage-associated protein